MESAEKKTWYSPRIEDETILQEREKFQQVMKEEKPTYYLDESGSCTGIESQYGRSASGTRAYCSQKGKKGERVNTIAILANSGIQASFSFEGTLNGDLFYYYTKEFLLPILRKGDRLILDNASAHLNLDALDLLGEHGVEVRFLPPRSPDLNPIEMAWSKVKAYMKRVTTKTILDLYEAFKEGLKTITSQDAIQYIQHCQGVSLLKT